MKITNMKIVKNIIVAIIVLTLAACGQNNTQSEKPSPAILTDDAIGHSDKMIVVNHEGPRAQVHLANIEIPLWFSSVRDGLAYVKSSERSDEIVAIYVNDVGVAKSWREMGKGNWIDAEKAFFVGGSSAIGGMGAPEFVPFASKEKALEFIAQKGGELLSLNDISVDMVLAPVDINMMDMDMSGKNSNMQMQTPALDHSTMNMNQTPNESSASTGE